MKKDKNRFFAVCLTIVMLLSTVPIGAFASIDFNLNFGLVANAADNTDYDLYVQDADGKPIKGAIAYIYSGKDLIWQSGLSSEEGGISLDGFDVEKNPKATISARIRFDNGIELCSDVVSPEGVWEGKNVGKLFKTGVPTLEAREPRLIVSLSVAHVGNSKYNSLKRIKNVLSDCSASVAQMTNGHVIISDFSLKMVGTETELEKNDSDILIYPTDDMHSNANPFGYFGDGRYHICTCINELSAETLAHEIGHYICGFFDEYCYGDGYGYDTNGNGTIDDEESNDGYWSTHDFYGFLQSYTLVSGRIARPQGAPSNFGVMECPNVDIEMSSARSYSYLTDYGLDPTDPKNVTKQHSERKTSCEEWLASTLEGLTAEKGFSASYSLSTKTETVSYPFAKIEPIGIKEMSALEEEIGFFNQYIETNTPLTDISFSKHGQSLTAEYNTNANIVCYYALKDSEFSILNPENDGTVSRITVPISTNQSSILLIADSEALTFNTYMIDSSDDELMESGFYSIDSSVNHSHTVVVSSKVENQYNNLVRVNKELNIMLSDSTDRVLKSVVVSTNSINYNTLSWYYYNNHALEKINSTLLASENNDVEVVCRADRSGRYILLAAPAESNQALPLSNLSISPTAIDGKITLSFTDNNPENEVMYYEVVVADEEINNQNITEFPHYCLNTINQSVPLAVSDLDVYYIAARVVLVNGSYSEYSQNLMYEVYRNDSNGDGIPDSWFDEYYMLEDSDTIASEDSDYDGVSNLDEYLNGTNPLDHESICAVHSEIVDVVVAEELFEGFSVDLIDLMADTLFHFKSSVNISGYRLKTEEDITALFSALQKYYPAKYAALFATTDFSYKVVSSPSHGIITKLYLYYGDDVNLSAFEKRAKDLQDEIDTLVNAVADYDDFEKALYIHDYILLHSEYDMELADYIEANGGIVVGTEYYNERYTNYSILVNGTGVCDSYATAYRAVLNAAGVECVYVSSETMSHAWNEVNLNGNWYHVDCTWDDPVPDAYGRASREFFLLTDNEIRELRHYAWTPGNYRADSTTYSAMPRSLDTVQKYDYESDQWYFLDSGVVVKTDRFGQNAMTVCSLRAKTIAVDQGKLYYSNGRSVYQYAADGDAKLVYVLPSSKSGTVLGQAYLKNIYIDGSNITFYKVIMSDDASIITVYGTDVFNGDKYFVATKTGECGEDAVWSLVNNTELTIEGSGAITDTPWDTYAATIQSVVVSDAITSIPEAAFASCVNLKKLSVPFIGANRDENLNDKAVLGYLFEKTSSGSGTTQYHREENNRLYGYTYAIPASLQEVAVTDATQIPFGAFYNCATLTAITLNNGVQLIHSYAFANASSLSEIAIPNSVAEIEEDAFSGCSALEELQIPFVGRTVDANNDYDAVLGYIFGRTDSSGVKQYCKLNGSQISLYYFAIPTSLKKVVVTNDPEIPLGAFSNCSMLKQIILSEKTARLNEFAVYAIASLDRLEIHNRNCDIQDSYGAFGIQGTIYGYQGSTAESFATNRNILFVPLDNVHTHTWDSGEITTPATCKEEGVKTLTCNTCGATMTESVPVDETNHAAYGTKLVNEKVATCKENGYTGDTVCKGCGAVLTAGEMIPKETVGHTWDDGVVTLEPTTEAPGVRTYTCTVCSATRTEEIPKLKEVQPGDINGDGVLNSKDLTRLMKYLAGEDVFVEASVLDVNGDGTVNNKDLTRLMKYLAGEDVEIY